MTSKKTGTKVDVPGVGKGTVEGHPIIRKGEEVQEVRTGDNTTIYVPTKKL